MMRFVSLLAVSLAVVGVGVGCGSLSNQPLELGQADAGSTVTLSPGDVLSVVLEGNPTTGYMWEVSAVDEAVLTPVGEPEFKADSAAIGSGGEITLRFEAVASGQTTLELAYRRPWEEGVEPLETYSVTVVVE